MMEKPILFTRRFMLTALPASVFVTACSGQAGGQTIQVQSSSFGDNEWRKLTEEEWRQRLSPAAFRVLRQEGTERAFTSPLNEEKRDGVYHCAGCDLPLFESAHKYDSGTGWPSFWKPIEGALNTKPDRKLIYVRTEYHCARCGGHQGHVFKDGPPPTGQRWCNNGVALTFRPTV